MRSLGVAVGGDENVSARCSLILAWLGAAVP